jgi:type IV pilus assembly protein PilW
VTNANPMGCFNNAKLGSDVLQLKRVIAAPLQIFVGVPPVATPVVNTVTNNFFLVANLNEGIIFPEGAVPFIDNSRVWEYQHHVYYVSNQVEGTNVVPVLMQGQLTNTMVFSPIIDGIDMIRFMYGLDTNNSGTVDAFVSANGVLGNGGMNEALWDSGRILAVKIYVLARSIRPDNDYNNTSTYQLGDLPFTVNDNFRRLLFTSTVSLYNSSNDGW